MNDILDIEGNFFVRFKIYFQIGLILLSIIILAVVGFLVSKRYKKKSKSKITSPDQEALQALDSLLQMNLIKKGEIKRYCFFVSEILRKYIEDRFGYPALEKTTPEIIAYLRNCHPPTGPHKERPLFMWSGDPKNMDSRISTSDVGGDMSAANSRLITAGNDIASFLYNTDEVKFAGAVKNETELESFALFVRQFVQSTQSS